MSVGELQPSGRKLRQQRSERIIQFLLMIVATSGVLITFGVVFALVRPSVDFFVRLASENFLVQQLGFRFMSHQILVYGR